jgi:hypothetical protein
MHIIGVIQCGPVSGKIYSQGQFGFVTTEFNDFKPAQRLIACLFDFVTFKNSVTGKTFRWVAVDGWVLCVF